MEIFYIFFPKKSWKCSVYVTPTAHLTLDCHILSAQWPHIASNYHNEQWRNFRFLKQVPSSWRDPMMSFVKMEITFMALFAEENEQTLKCFVKRKRLYVASRLSVLCNTRLSNIAPFSLGEMPKSYVIWDIAQESARWRHFPLSKWENLVDTVSGNWENFKPSSPPHLPPSLSMANTFASTLHWFLKSLWQLSFYK